MGWHEHNRDVHHGCERFFRPGYHAHLIEEWLPALGVADRLREGASVADVGCGHGASTVLMAQAFPASRFHGSDYHAESIEVGPRAGRRGGRGRPGHLRGRTGRRLHRAGFDLVTIFDCPARHG